MRRPRRFHRIPTPLLTVGTVAALLLVPAACGSAVDEASEKAGEQLAERLTEAQAGGDVDVDIDSDEGSFSVDTPDGSFDFGSGTLPEEWPDDVPVPDDLEVLSGSTSSTADGRVVAVAGVTATSPEDLLAEFTAALAGWEISGEATTTSGTGSTTTAQWDLNGRRLTFAAIGDGSQTTLTLGHTSPA